MALRICADEERHAQHRWTYKDYEPFCPGRYTSEDGAWLAERSSRRHKLSGHVHFYLPDEPRSICGYGWRREGMLGFDPVNHMTTENDPRFNQPQFRSPCTHCTNAVIASEEDRA